MIAKLDGFEWKGAGPLALKQNVDVLHGIIPNRLLQIQPPAALTAISLNSAWGL